MDVADPRATSLWHELHGPGCAGTRPPHWLVAREQPSQRIVAIAQYFRTFPPEDACAAVLVQPDAVHSGAGERVFRVMAAQALADGIRTLGTLVGHDDHTTLDLLRNAGAPLRISPVSDGLYIEIDLLAFAGSTQLRGEKLMETTNTLQTEHNAVLYVVDQLEHASDAAAHGQPVPRDVFADIDEFFRIFVDRCHHAKEETVLFPRLTGGELSGQLEAEHTEGRRLAQAYHDAVEVYMPGDVTSGARVQNSAAEYAAMLREHIAKEAGELLPAVNRELAAEDAALVEAFERIETERIGAGTHERLHGMIGTLAARIAPFVAAVAGSR
jgi:hemerythrin-like domain-containing protein